MNKELNTAFHALAACGWVITLLAFSSAATAQSAAPSGSSISTMEKSTQATVQASTNPSQNEATDVEDSGFAPLQVGNATQGLLARQRSGDIASKTPRPIAGSIAQRSYERYLKSFEFPVPERLSSTVKTSTGSGGAK